MGIFDDIKVGDKVLTEVFIKRDTWGWHGRSFVVGATVVRVTPKRFVLGNGSQYNKENGSRVGEYGRVQVYNVDKDQTEQATVYRQKIKLEVKMKEACYYLHKLDEEGLDKLTDEDKLSIINLYLKTQET